MKRKRRREGKRKKKRKKREEPRKVWISLIPVSPLCELFFFSSLTKIGVFFVDFVRSLSYLPV